MKPQQEKIIISLKKAKSSLEKIISMIENEQYCIKVIQQNLAVIGLLKSTNIQLLEDHLGCCFINAVKSNDKKRQAEMIEEILTIVKTAQNK
ncbi:Copper-sensing transcriptional repressor CsoR [candidate division SR1 bacterium Aalborg_AAW-1]|nr:Copper-sensing transcriptional repressor CsoR [candidate division SR1 bacterium Aalborg_AAW-1]